MEEPDINKAIKERFQGGWKASLLSLVRNSANADVMEIWRRQMDWQLKMKMVGVNLIYSVLS